MLQLPYDLLMAMLIEPSINTFSIINLKPYEARTEHFDFHEVLSKCCTHFRHWESYESFWTIMVKCPVKRLFHWFWTCGRHIGMDWTL